MNFCSHCGAAVTLEVPAGDDRPRHVCQSCGTIHYQNPKIVAGSIPEWDGQVLLCRRAIEPRYGLWTIPAGFMENGETVEQAAVRETWEEARAELVDRELYALYNIPYIDHVYVIYRAALPAPTFAAGPESLEVRLFDEQDIPWDKLAFRVVTAVLGRYFADRRNGRFTTLVDEIRR